LTACAEKAPTNSADGVGDDAGLTTTTVRGEDSGATTTSAKRAGTGSSTRGSGQGASPPSGATVNAANGEPGAYAGVLLGPGSADAIVVDVLVQSGVTPSSDALSRLPDILGQASGKPVTVNGPAPLTSSNSVHSASEIRAAADEQDHASQTARRAVIHLLYFAGAYTDDKALGVIVRGDTIAIFPEQIDAATSPLVGRARLERAVLTHELGHAMGLVDLYLDGNRDDSDHPGHSTNRSSVMFWAVETDVVSQILGGPPPVDFDDADRIDLARIRSGAASQM
jgi:hypothetical protein